MSAPGRIDDKTQVPLGSVQRLFAAGIGVAIAGTWWVGSYMASVNLRLTRLEDRLNVGRAPASNTLETAWSAQASQPDPRGPKPKEGFTE